MQEGCAPQDAGLLKALAAHLIRTAERVGFLSAPTAQLAAIARLHGRASGLFARVQMRLLRLHEP